MADQYTQKYLKGKPIKTIEGASPARGKPAKTSIYANSTNQLPAVGPYVLGDNNGSGKSMKKAKGY